MPKPARIYIVATGAGSTAGSWLLGVPGASASVLEMCVPYAKASLAKFLGGEPKHFCCEETAVAMAEKAYERALHLWMMDNDGNPHCVGGENFMGVSITGAIVSSTPKRGEHRVHVAAKTALGTTTYTLCLAKGERDRVGEEHVASRLVIRAIAEAAQTPVSDEFSACSLLEGEVVQGPIFTPTSSALQKLLSSKLSNVLVLPLGSMPSTPQGPGAATTATALEIADFIPARKSILVPGSFNPIHQGHVEMAKKAQQQVILTAAAAGEAEDGDAGITPPIILEISAFNADKPTIGYDAVADRVRLIQKAGLAVAVTNAPLFSDKAKMFPNSLFVVGADTARRIIDKKYYGGTEAGVVLALGYIRHQGCGFIVAGRKETDDEFLTLPMILQGSTLPPALQSLFTELEDFRLDISSTDIRRANEKEKS
eukprot:CAMPEP_0185771542 /NCGR_PEP_ID=MMETSP1174-20130828/64366_1 /TAXON_ID=35687 /ORGANISM="Dictyocha speculum, Strain CCMP1381" /LENGTH=425 /DNA_ID=CAMNT_0028457435 /DNA_START=160 /DNA_END=1437 /DNA_ORIENTATION=+